MQMVTASYIFLASEGFALYDNLSIIIVTIVPLGLFPVFMSCLKESKYVVTRS